MNSSTQSNNNKGTLMTRDDIGGIMVALDGLRENNESIREDSRYLRNRMDGHIEKDVANQKCVQRQLSDIALQVSTHKAVVDTKMKTFVAMISGFVSLAVASVGWALTKVFGA